MALRHRFLFNTMPKLLRVKFYKETDEQALCLLGAIYIHSRNFSATHFSAHPKNLIGAVCLERYPIITANKTKLEERFANVLSQIELEKSYYSDHELRLLREKQTVKVKSDEDDSHTEAQTGLDLEDQWDAEFKAFKPAPRETEADKKDDRQSLDRKLDSILYLLVKQNISGKDHWILPQTSWKEGETVRQTAERALSSVGGDIKATFLGNAPCGFAKFEPVKIFFFKAWYREGQIIPNGESTKDFLWVTRNELSQYCFSTYSKNIHKFIPPF